MIVHQLKQEAGNDWEFSSIPELRTDYQLVLVFGSRLLLGEYAWYRSLSERFPDAKIVSVSTSGNILQEEVSDESLVASLIFLEKTSIRTVVTNMANQSSSYDAGIDIASHLDEAGLCHMFVFSDGAKVNGSELVRGLSRNLKVPVTGGLAGDGPRFEKTLVGLDSVPSEGNIVCIGFYGDQLSVGFSYFGGWDPFGPERVVTKSASNILYELDGKSALELYKNYLGEKAKELPGSALLFPLSMRTEASALPLTRTILSINPDGGMVFAGDLPEGAIVQLMKANFEKLIDASTVAAERSFSQMQQGAEFALLISCVGRKLVLGQRIEEEVEAVREVLGPEPVMAGFYSYGEISSQSGFMKCELHNQTMTITMMKEV
jgi:hypothetical protein